MLSLDKLTTCYDYVLIRPRRRALFDYVIYVTVGDKALKLGLMLAYVFRG